MQRVKNALDNITRTECEDFKAIKDKYSSRGISYEKDGCLLCGYKRLKQDTCQKEHPTILVFAALEGRGRDCFIMKRLLDGLISW